MLTKQQAKRLRQLVEDRGFVEAIKSYAPCYQKRELLKLISLFIDHIDECVAASNLLYWGYEYCKMGNDKSFITAIQSHLLTQGEKSPPPRSKK